MIILMFIQVILMLWIVYISRKLYINGDYNDLTFNKKDKVKIPIILYLLLIILSFVPIGGIIFEISIFYIIVSNLIEEKLYYKPGKITQFLFKQI